MHCMDNLMTPYALFFAYLCSDQPLPATLVRSELPVLSSLLISFSLTYMWVPPIITHLYSLLFFFRFPPPPAGEAKGWI